jgi:hypothetical protein
LILPLKPFLDLRRRYVVPEATPELAREAA